MRRTDKVGSEAAFHSIEEYMKHADAWFQLQALKTGTEIPKRVYLATDDPGLIEETKLVSHTAVRILRFLTTFLKASLLKKAVNYSLSLQITNKPSLLYFTPYNMKSIPYSCVKL